METFLRFCLRRNLVEEVVDHGVHKQCMYLVLDYFTLHELVKEFLSRFRAVVVKTPQLSEEIASVLVESIYMERTVLFLGLDKRIRRLDRLYKSILIGTV